MKKDNLNNLLFFKEFAELKNNKGVTKRTETSLDILNENFYDKLISNIKNNKPLDEIINEFKARIDRAGKSGQITKLKIDDEIYTFNILNRSFKIEFDDNDCTVYIKTPINDWVEFILPESDCIKLKDMLDNLS